MGRSVSWGLGILWVATLLLPVSAQANLIANGNFSSSCQDANFCTYAAGDSTDVPGWTVSQGSIDLITHYWQAPPTGGNSIDLDGFFQRGGIASTTFGTTTGSDYQLTFWLSGNPDGGVIRLNPSKLASGIRFKPLPLTPRPRATITAT